VNWPRWRLPGAAAAPEGFGLGEDCLKTGKFSVSQERSTDGEGAGDDAVEPCGEAAADAVGEPVGGSECQRVLACVAGGSAGEREVCVTLLRGQW